MTLCVRFTSFVIYVPPTLCSLGLPWLDDEQATLKFGAERLLALLDGTVIENQVIERRPERQLLSSTKVQKFMRKSPRAKGRTGDFFTLNLAVDKQQFPSELHLGNEFNDAHREDFRKI
jgi:hypothetical protein